MSRWGRFVEAQRDIARRRLAAAEAVGSTGAEDTGRDRLAAERRSAEAERARAETAALSGRTWLCGTCGAEGVGALSAFAHVHRRTRRPHPVRFAEDAP